MRAAPPIAISLRRFGIWNAAVLTLGMAGAAALVAWGSLRSDPFGPAAWAAVAAGVLASAAFLVAPLLRVEPAALNWDGRSWHLGPRPEATTPGELEVALDLGGWLLLRFTEAGPPASGRRRPVHWLPVQRRGLEAAWHGLRCAVYAPRPASVEPASAGSAPKDGR